MAEAAAPWPRHLAALWVAQFVAAAALSLALPFVPLYAQTLGAPAPAAAALWAGASSAAFTLGLLATGPFWGARRGRDSARLTAGRALFAAALVLASMGLARSVQHLFVLRLVQGGIGGVQATLTTMVGSIVPRRRLAWSVGLLQTATLGGASLGPLVGGFVADRYGFRPGFWLTGGLLAYAGLTVLFGLPDTRLVTRPPARFGAVYGLRPTGLTRPVLVLVGALIALQFAATVTSPVLPLFVQALSPASTTVAFTTGLIVGLSGFFGAFSAIAAGQVVGPRQHKLLLLMAALGAALLYAPQAMVTSAGQLLALRVGLGLCSGALIPAAQALLTFASPPERRGATFALASSVATIGSLAGPFAGGVIAATLGLRAVFTITAALLFAVCLAVGWAIRTPQPA